MHRNNCLWRKRTQIHDALKTEDKQHGSSCDRGQLCLFHPWKWMGSKVRLDFTHTSFALGCPARSELAVLSCVEGQWKAHEGREKFSGSIWVLGRHFTWPWTGPQCNGECHSCSKMCCQVPNCLMKVEQLISYTWSTGRFPSQGIL